MALEQEIKDRAISLGFDAVGITDASPIADPEVAHLQRWLQAGRAGQMHYMYRHFEKRIYPGALLKGAQSVIVVALNYRPNPTSPPRRNPRLTGRVAHYAWYEDYHDCLRPRLFELADFIDERTRRRHRVKACVDSVPLAERALAVRAGLGFIGTNHMLIHPTLGPEVFLGELLTTAVLEPDEPTCGRCAACDRCVRACPTGALQTNGEFDAQKCISYLTIEHKGDITPDLAAKIGDRIFGCDACVLACPHQHVAPACDNTTLRSRREHAQLDLQDVLDWTPGSFDERFVDSPIRRAGRERLQRNARICMENARHRLQT